MTRCVSVTTRSQRRIEALGAALAEAIGYAVHDLRGVIECGTLDGDLTTANKETRAAIAETNAILEHWNMVLYGVPHPAGVCRFCRCTYESACELPDGEPCAWYTAEVCTNPACILAFKAISKTRAARGEGVNDTPNHSHLRRTRSERGRL